MRLPVVAALTISLLSFAATLPAQAQGTQQTVQLAKIDVVKASTGYRASKVIGASIINDANETVGKVDDVILGDDRTSYAVLSVGGFLGVGNKLVALPYEAIRKTDEKLIIPGATKDALKALPEFKYASK
ncbi:PRC-barrel domain-containing protein [Reyranella sp.]|uniref:PRC-barrel domain-containing protein n=1 Tax=Reyranella sp. TaxID=1929291 RepID=UPI003D11E503